MAKRAIVVGLNEHPTDPLAYAEGDAEDIATVLAEPQYGFEVIRLIGPDATRTAILNAFTEQAEERPSTLLFYFSGHGFMTTWGAVYLHTSGAERIDEGLDVHHLAMLLQAQQSNNSSTFAMLDCCHAGAATAWVDARPVTANVMDSQLRVQRETHAVLAACRPGGEAFSAVSTNNGGLTAFLIDGMLGGAADHRGAVTVDGLASYVKKVFNNGVQNVVYRTDSAGEETLGKGFEPVRSRPLTGVDIEGLISDARVKLSSYEVELASYLNEWQDSGYGAACRKLRPILRWFDTKTTNHPELVNSAPFQAELNRANSKLVFLQNLEEGLVFDGRRVIANLGSGSFGTVWLVESLSDGHKEALKIFRGDELNNRNKRAMFDRGYRAMEQMDHPRVVKVQGQSSVPFGFYMEYIEGSNLALIPTPTDDPSVAIRILILAAETVKHAHQAGVVHRDIKPENLLVVLSASATWLPYLTDFDLSWFSTASRLASEAMAPLAYCAPEYFEYPQSELARRPTVDTYSFAQLAYFLTVGSSPLPFRTSDNVATLEGKTKGWYVGEAASQFVTLYRNCSQLDPDKRPPDFTSIIESLVSIETKLIDADDNPLGRDALLSEIQFSLRALPGEESGLLAVFFKACRVGPTWYWVSSESDGIRRSLFMTCGFSCN